MCHMQLGYCAANMRRHTQTSTGTLVLTKDTTGEGIERAAYIGPTFLRTPFLSFSIFPACRVDAPLNKLKCQTGLSVTTVRFVRDAMSSIVDVVCDPDVLPNTRDGKIDNPMPLLGAPSTIFTTTHSSRASAPVRTTRRLNTPEDLSRKAGPCSIWSLVFSRG
ncbi:hypothetical protein BDP81DRAFT_495638 [Colletotrichum phormii]|uniref:Uncharacterized protein n=1 Tax=Colletotrichum phormii TaxID=359342 RepID=A0AAJ0EBT0_9PEZI|nr:uncharacterized protein BDP81DRAFT_495638 [Colletotrichum phormii]KAK1633309.1 hypothetical protein BDP81DRAFT_495638 [Colletotrichum phormii]